MAEQPKQAEAPITFAVAFDIGTRTTGYALSHNNKPLLICAGLFEGSHAVERAPTSVLIDDQEQFVAFGVEAEDKYAALGKKEKDSGWAIFRRFKDQINHLTDVNTNEIEVVDISNSVKVPAISIFTMVIAYLKRQALKVIRSKPAMLKVDDNVEVDEDNVDYAITVPALWDDSIRCMVRYAAFEAGISSDRLQLIPESDAATIWCHKDPELNMPELQKPGTKYMVINMGDSKMEITAHEITNRDNLKQLSRRPEVIPYGGRVVDDKFLTFFELLFGKETMKEFANDHPKDYDELVDSFTAIKRKMTLDYEDKFNIKLPAVLCEINTANTKDTGKDFRSEIKTYEPYLALKADKLRIEPGFVKIQIFGVCIKNLVSRMKEHPNLHDTEYVFCTGGFSNCKLITGILAAELPTKRIICPREGEYSVVKGAVIYRHRPGVFGRQADFTYGRSEYVLFDKKTHHGKQGCVVGDEVWCQDVFRKYVTKGDEIPYDFAKTDHGLLPMEGLRLNATCNLYLSVDESPQFVTDIGCEQIGEPFVHKFRHEQQLQDRAYDLTVRFLFDEIHVTFSHKKSGKTETKVYNFI